LKDYYWDSFSEIKKPKKKVNTEPSRDLLGALVRHPPGAYGLDHPTYNKFNFCSCSRQMSGLYDMYNLKVDRCTNSTSMDPNELVDRYRDLQDKCNFHKLADELIQHYHKRLTGNTMFPNEYSHYAYYQKSMPPPVKTAN